MKNLSPFAQVCVTLIEKEELEIEGVPPMVLDEVTFFYKNKEEEEEGEDVDV